MAVHARHDSGAVKKSAFAGVGPFLGAAQKGRGIPSTLSAVATVLKRRIDAVPSPD